jgi:hypothetical protein
MTEIDKERLAEWVRHMPVSEEYKEAYIKSLDEQEIDPWPSAPSKQHNSPDF